jgi:hypothetical protein
MLGDENMTSEKYAARLTIYNAADMTAQGKKDIANWLRKQAEFLLKDGDNFSKRFTAKYYYQ